MPSYVLLFCHKHLGHSYNITINSDVCIGNNVNIHKGATIGRENRGQRKGCPIIGDNVYIGINATIVGRIIIGNDVLITANSFLNKDVPDHSIAIGNPAIIIPRVNATEGYINKRIDIEAINSVGVNKNQIINEINN